MLSAAFEFYEQNKGAITVDQQGEIEDRLSAVVQLCEADRQLN